MHTAGVCHRDLKLENIVLDAQYNLKVIDLGMACPYAVPSGFEETVFCGTKGYRAPEIVTMCAYQPYITDLFSLGVIIFSLVTGRFPFGDASINDPYYEFIVRNNQSKFWQNHERSLGAPLCPLFKDLMTNMFAYQPYQRLNLVEIIMHPFFSQNDVATMAEAQEEMASRRI